MGTSKAQSQSQGRVIVAEDDQDLRESIVKYLTLAGYEVTGASSALEFYQQVSEQSYSVAILDVGLPDQSGLVLSQYLRSNTDMRIIILTARSTLDDKLAGYNSGADIFIVKPVDIRELTASVSSLLGRVSCDLLGQRCDERHVKLVRRESEEWCFISSKWLLKTPCGKEIKLTSKEIEFLNLLISEGNKAVARRNLLKELEYLNNDYGNRSLESLVNRLRKKITNVCENCPIQTNHGIGYSFSAAIAIE
ncbi:MAG: response regulator transcription factor [Chlorobiaceae bacterium]